MAELSSHDVQRIADAVASKMQRGHVLDHSQASNIAAAAARTAVQEMAAKCMALLGVDAANSEHIDTLKANMAFIQRLRLRSESIGQSVSNAVSNAVALGLIALLLLGAFVWLKGASTQVPPVISIK